MQMKSENQPKQQEQDGEIILSLPKLSKLKDSPFYKQILTLNYKQILNPKLLVFLLLILIPIIISVGARIQPIELKMTDDWARNTLYTSVKSQIQASVDQQNPTLSAQSRKSIVDEQYSQALRDQAAQLETQAKGLADYYKTAFQYSENNHTYTYLGDLDSYFYLRQARNILEHGDICDQVEGGKCIDDHMMAPFGSVTERTLHPYAIVQTYKILHFFNPQINLMYASFYLPTIIAVLVSILAFLVARKIAGNVAGFFASIFISTSTIFLTRTMGSDTDIWNIFFPILVLYLFITAVEARPLWKKLFFASLLGLAFGAYSFAWGAWWFSFDLVLLTYGLFLLYSLAQDLVEHKTDFRKILQNHKLAQDLATFLALIISAGISISLISSPHTFIAAPLQPFVMNTIDDAAKEDIWPNVYTTVAELNNSSLSEAVNTVGGKAFFFLICMGIILALIGKELKTRELTYLLISAAAYFLLVQDLALGFGIMAYIVLLCIPFLIAILMVFKDRTVEIKHAMLLLLWTMASLYAAMKGVRFVLLLIPVAGVAFGVAIGRIHSLTTSLIHRQLNLSRVMTGIILFLLLSLLLISPVKSAYAVGRNFLPSISSTWADSLTSIRDNSSENAIINSWWDFGHWFKYFADRRVTFDGASQNVPQAHWIGKALLTSDENVSIGILRMLDCGANRAYDTLLPLLDNDSLKAIDLINQIIVLDKPEARKLLISALGDGAKADEVLGYTHCDPPEDYFITSDDMVGKAGVWAHFGSWNFEKASIYNNIQGKTKSEAIQVMKSAGYTDEAAEALYSEISGLESQGSVNAWIAPWPGYTTETISCARSDQTLTCGLGLGLAQTQQYTVIADSAIINLTKPQESYIAISYISRTDNSVLGTDKAAAAGVVIAEPGGLNRYEPAADMQKVGFDIVVDTQNSRIIISDPTISQSLFTRLYFLDGRYTTHFQKFFDQQNQVVDHRIIVWKVDWGGGQRIFT